MKKIIIVTGANGFLGNNIVRLLSSNEDIELRGLVLKGTNIEPIKGLCNIYYGDVTDINSLNDIFENKNHLPMYVIHCAAIVYIKSKPNKNVYNVNVTGVKNIVKKVLETNSKLVYVSSVHAIKETNGIIKETKYFNKDEVHGVYAKTKAEAAKYILDKVQSNNLNACIVHPSGMIGPNDYSNTHLTEMIKEVMNNKIPTVVRGGYNFIDVRDVAMATINALDLGISGETYLLTNQYISIYDLVNLVAKLSNSKKIKIILPMWIAKLVAPFCELYYNLRNKTPLFTSYSLYTLSSNGNFDNSKAKSKLKLKTRSIEDTIKDTIDFIKK